ARLPSVEPGWDKPGGHAGGDRRPTAEADRRELASGANTGQLGQGPRTRCSRASCAAGQAHDSSGDILGAVPGLSGEGAAGRLADSVNHVTHPVRNREPPVGDGVHPANQRYRGPHVVQMAAELADEIQTVAAM